jgi:hypothetical protein
MANPAAGGTFYDRRAGYSGAPDSIRADWASSGVIRRAFLIAKT